MAEILVLSKGEDSPSTRYRALQFFDRLREAGHVPQHLSLSGGAGNVLRALRAARQADLVLVLRKTLPRPLLWLLRKASRRLVFDFDDAIFCKPDGSPSSTRMSRFAAMLCCSDHVTAGNTFLAEIAARFNPAVTVIPTCVDVDRYLPNDGASSEHFDVVWIGSSSTRKYLEAAIPALREAARRIPTLRLKIIADFDLDAPGFQTVPVPWLAATEAAELASAHVGIAPMHDDDWSRGKCALKVLQYMAAALPVVSSPVGANRQTVLDGETGFLASDNSAWVAALLSLANDKELNTRMGRRGRERVENIYSRDVIGRILLKVFAKVLSEA